MMLCTSDGAEKHMRWFWVDAAARTLCWGKKPRVVVKGPFVLTGVEEGEYPRGDVWLTPSTYLRLLTDGETALVKPDDDAIYELWLHGCRAVLDSGHTARQLVDEEVVPEPGPEPGPEPEPEPQPEPELEPGLELVPELEPGSQPDGPRMDGASSSSQLEEGLTDEASSITEKLESACETMTTENAPVSHFLAQFEGAAAVAEAAASYVPVVKSVLKAAKGVYKVRHFSIFPGLF